MKLVKSLLLGSAAGILAAAGAQAADLPSRKAAPVEYVRICDAFGAGYFYIPGSETCLKLSGYVMGDYVFETVKSVQFMNPVGAVAGGAASKGAAVSSKSLDATGFRTRGELQIDSRTQTAYGTLRGYFRIRLNYFSGVPNNGYTTTGPVAASTGASLDKGFIQFAGFTVGKAQSMFDFYADSLTWEKSFGGSDASNNMFAYTFNAGGGFSATLAIEDRNQRNAGIYGLSAATATHGFGPVSYGGQRAPDVIANLRVDQAWGAAQISGAAHQLNTISSPTLSATTPLTSSTYGYGVQAGVMINLPWLAAGDQLWAQAAYANGALDYVGLGPNSSGSITSNFLGRQIGGLMRIDGDAVGVYNVTNTAYTLEKEKAYTVVLGGKHYFAPNLVMSVVGSYINIRPGGATQTTDWSAGGLGRANAYIINSDLTWTIVKGLDLGLTGVYTRINQTIASNPLVGASASPVFAGCAGLVGCRIHTNNFEGRVRVLRSF